VLYTADVATWLQAFSTYPTDNDLPVPIETPTKEVDVPGRLIYLSVGPGTPTLNERTFDCHSVQIRCRGPQNDPDGGEQFMGLIDNLIMGVHCPVTVGRRVIDIDYMGGPPQFLLLDAAVCSHFVARYLFTIAREVF
jgi:hypothetical protein